MTELGLVRDPDIGLPAGSPVPNFRPARKPDRATLCGSRVVVAPLDPVAHADALYAASHGPEKEKLWFYLQSGPFSDLNQYQRYLKKFAVGDDPLPFTLMEKSSRVPCGTASLLRIVPEHAVIEIGHIWLGPKFQRSAGATEAMFLLARYVFDELGNRRYEWKCNALNAASRSAALRLGFRFEGIFRSHMVVKGRNRDTAWYAMTEEEWPLAKQAFERWLDPANFTPEGVQRRSLGQLRNK